MITGIYLYHNCQCPIKPYTVVIIQVESYNDRQVKIIPDMIAVQAFPLSGCEYSQLQAVRVPLFTKVQETSSQFCLQSPQTWHDLLSRFWLHQHLLHSHHWVLCVNKKIKYYNEAISDLLLTIKIEPACVSYP